ncbi:hypothetical protein F4604DRAFT_1925885 [Suillus subluteus]|nr:hypothetical protein F4604DRAFT_1925885 [Suillus subluteus]
MPFSRDAESSVAPKARKHGQRPSSQKTSARLSKTALPTSNKDASGSDSESDNDSYQSDMDEYKLYDLPECLLAIKNVKDQMLETIGDDPCTFTKGILHLYAESLLVD